MPSGRVRLTCIPEAEFPLEKESPQPPADDTEDYDAHARHFHAGYDPTHTMGGVRDVRGRMLYDDSGTNIDVLVVWTKDAECVNSRLSRGCNLAATTESNMRGLIDLAVEETNTAYALSASCRRCVWYMRIATQPMSNPPVSVRPYQICARPPMVNWTMYTHCVLCMVPIWYK
jgi:hypothetical protein